MCIARISPSCLRQGRGKRGEEERFGKDDFNRVSKIKSQAVCHPTSREQFQLLWNKIARIRRQKEVSSGSDSGWEDCSSWTWHSGLSWQESYSQVAIQSSFSHGFLQG